MNDPRSLLRYFEVHYWPRTGRVTMIHAEPMYGTGTPVITHVQVIGTADSADTADTAMLTAMALNAYATPTGDVYEHDADGNVWLIDTDNCQARIRVPSSTGNAGN
jgi:hypothetical protein